MNLLTQIADQLHSFDLVKLAAIKVTFSDNSGECNFEFTLPLALECIANDIYWDERGNWCDATAATVESF